MGQLLGQQPKEPSKWATLTRWRDWRLSAKLAAVSLVPIVVALVLGGVTIGNQVERSGNYERMNRLVELNGAVRTLVDALQQERTETAALLTQGTVGSSPQLDAARGLVDEATGPVSSATGHAADADEGVRAPGEAAQAAVGRLPEVRRQVAEGRLDAVQALAAYSEMTESLIGLDTALVAGIGDDAIGGTPSALHDVLVVKEEASTTQSLLGYGIARGNLTPSQLNDLRTAELRLADRLADFRAAASSAQEAQFDRSVMGQDFNTRSRLVNGVLAAEGASVPSALRGISSQQWTAVSASVIAALNTVSDSLGDELTTTSADLADSAGTDAGLLAVLLFLALVVTAAVVILITRQLLQSLRMLRAGALDVADRQLPAAVQNIQEGREQSTDVQPLSVGTTDEIGEVAKAFDAVHSQALRLAVEQANMRTGYSSVFVNLSRRSQSLVQRQLQLIERLERDEEDADQLATLFQLDHLATRMRRNNENLMVLSGAEPGRRSGQPVTTSDVLRAAVSEIEQYQRVVVQTPPEARIVGFAASDLMRLVAELLDNATAFSAPETQVTVTTRAADHGGLVIDIIDQGIGMNEAEVAEANARLTEAGTVDLATSRRMGLFVVGRLAGRHDIGVVLHGGKDIVGVRATVTVPADLVMDLPAPAPVRPDPSTALPRRRTVNGAGRPEALANFGQAPTPGDGASSPSWTQNGHSGVLPPRPPSDLEISGTALFTPIPAEGEEPAAPAPAPIAEAPAEPEPEPAPGELPSGKALFTANSSPLSEWWSSAANEPKPATPPPSRRETTPIFDETLSAWFRSDDPPAAASKTAESTSDKAESASGDKAASGWDFAVDENWRAVQAASQVEPKTFTDAGLPKRRRGEQLLPGSAAAETPAPNPQREIPVRDPADVRGRLSSFQRGVNRARHAKRDQPEGAAAPESAASAQSSAATTASEASSGAEQGGLPRRQPRPGAAAADSAEDRKPRPSAEAPQLDSGLPQRRPKPGASESAQPAAEAGLPGREPTAAGSTDAGLPRREPKAAGGSAKEGAKPAQSEPADTGLPRRQPKTAEPASAKSTDENLPRREPKAAKSQSDSGLPKREPKPAGSTDAGLPQREPKTAGPTGAGLPKSEPKSAGSTDSGLPRRQPKAAAQASETERSQSKEPAAQAGPGLPQPKDAEGTESGLPQRQPKDEAASRGEAQSASGLPQRQPKPADSGLPQRQPKDEAASRGEAQPASGLPQRQPKSTDSGVSQQQPVSAQADAALPQRQPGETGSGLPQRQTETGTGLPQRQSASAQAETSAGLPQRQPKPADSGLPQRQPRTDSGAGLFQSEGTGLFQRPGGTSEGTGLFQRPGPAPDTPAEPQPQSQQPQGQQPQGERRQGDAVAGGDGAWSFASDESWAAVQTVSSSPPSNFTAAGLPKRRRGEQLLPGSALAPGAPAPAPRTRRDPQDVRGRLSSFQQGVQRGRHRTAQSADPDQGTMEGE
ncbi:nitrate- and nitrite sensing domain-containing protein [Amycolatopsis methanolica]|uniref:histidine kinase n=1 Tax=Amycolatopsis methanolica 239 TaxID=1068978 RepID=A0A076N4P4_AMYME|nr:nitrate- and nitrite sensing domain-containing protein [Amycolatopsis methanolica]AIJ24962.1 histidine kinase-like ATPase containing nitrate/nitrite sensor domain [Amycolatopsis methanolica 239]